MLKKLKARNVNAAQLDRDVQTVFLTRNTPLAGENSSLRSLMDTVYTSGTRYPDRPAFAAAVGINASTEKIKFLNNFFSNS